MMQLLASQVAYCKSSADGNKSNANEAFTYNATTGLIVTLSGPVSGQCLGVEAGPAGGQLVAIDATDKAWCLTNQFVSEGGWMAAPCVSGVHRSSVGNQYFDVAVVESVDATCTTGPCGSGFVTIGGTPGPSFNNQFGGSGPVAHARYVTDGGSSPR